MLYKSLLHCSKRYSLLIMLLLFFSVFANAKYEVSVSPSSSAGSVTVTKNSNGSVSLMPSPKAGYVFSYYRSSYTNDGGYNWTYLGQKYDVPVILSVSDVNTSSLYHYTFYFTKSSTTYTITVKSNNTAYGTVSGGGTYAINASVTIKATPKTGYKFVKWNDGNTNASRTITLTKNATYTATFEPLKYTITWKNADGTTLKTEQVNYGTTPSYTGTTPTRAATAQYTYTFKGWAPTIVAATANATYTATYTQTLRQYTITWKNSDGTTLKTEQVNYGATPSYTGTTPTKPATAEYTYTFAGWTPEIVPATAAATYTARFDSTKVVYDVDVTIPDTIEAHGSVVIDGTPTYGETITLTPVPDEGYVFDGWSDGNTDNPREIVVDGDVNIYPIFHKCEEIIFHISKTIYRGESYPFGNEVLTAKGTYYDTIPLANGCDSVVELKLNVVKAPNYTLRVVVNDEMMGTVEGTGAYKAGTTVTITATPISNKYVFVRWYNEDEDIDVYENPYTFQLNRNLQLRAVFKKAPRRVPEKK